MSQPFYDPTISYEDNFLKGPFGTFISAPVLNRVGEPQENVFGHPVYLPFGIPAGPLINGKFVTAALWHGFDIAVYKTVRTRSYPCHPHPNVLAVHLKGDLTLENAQKPLVSDTNYDDSYLGITNSFGVPSPDPDYWQSDMKKAHESAGPGQMVWGSFQGTTKEGGGVAEYLEDWRLAAKLVAATGVPVLIANFSCPNEGTGNLLCFDTKRVVKVVDTIRSEIGNLPLVLKLAYFSDPNHLSQFVSATASLVDGYAAINTIPAPVVNPNGEPALPGKGREKSGICGAPIKWAGLDMVRRLHQLRQTHPYRYTIIGVGGVVTPKDYFDYRSAGADVVMSATGAMWHSNLAQEIYQEVYGI